MITTYYIFWFLVVFLYTSYPWLAPACKSVSTASSAHDNINYMLTSQEKLEIGGTKEKEQLCLQFPGSR